MAELLESVTSTLVLGETLGHLIATVPHQVQVRTRDAVVDQVVYELKHTRPSRLDLYKIASHTVDLATGKKTIETSRVRFDRAVVLPSQLESKFTFDLAYLAASRDFTQGGFYQQRMQVAVIDANLLPKVWGSPDTEQWCIVDNLQWEIIKVTNLGFRSYALTMMQTDGKEIVRVEDTNNNLILTDSVELV